MNTISVRGGNKKQRELVEDVVFWCIDYMMPRLRTLDIDINLKKIDDAEGYCLALSSREFEIEFDNRIKKEDDFITCVIHEMVHVWQYAYRLLKDTHTKQYWKGKDYTDTPYSKQPWEQQAYRLQEILYKLYLNWEEYL